MVSHSSPSPSCGGSTSTTQSEFTPGCSVRALARAGVPRPPWTRRITCARRATGLASKPGEAVAAELTPLNKRDRDPRRVAGQNVSPSTFTGLAPKLRPHPHSATCRTRSTQSCRYPRTTSRATSSSDARPRGNRFQPASTPGPWCLIHFQKSECVCTALLVKKTTGGTAPGPWSWKALNQVRTERVCGPRPADRH